VSDLLWHLSGVQRWATEIVRTGARERISRTALMHTFAPVPADAMADWFDDGARHLLATLRGADRALECWTFFAAPTPLAFWARRQAHEAAIHAVDVEVVTGTPSPFPAWFAADGIDELLVGFLPRGDDALPTAPHPGERALAIAPDDVAAGWTVRFGPGGPEVTPTVAPDAACTIAGSASDCYLYVWNRPTPQGAIALRGDTALLEYWKERSRVW
jgi:uncharacterized protein (TIGR03083 family)